MLEHLSAPQFAAQLDTAFQVVFEDVAPLTLQLCEVAEVDSGPAQEQFSLLFRGPGDRVLSQGLCRMQHQRLGELALFLVPIGPDEQGMQYEAVFNRFRRSARPA
jgi:hypothetical protein